MQIISNLCCIPNLSLALGFFDGVHIAHQKLIQKNVDFSKQNSLKSAVITLKQQPYCFLKHIEPKYISSRAESYKIIENLGIDYLIELDFNEISGMTSYEYLENILIKYFTPKAIFTGFNHHFGLNREGDCDFLAKYQYNFGYKFEMLNSQKLNGNLISSSAIRRYIEQGDIKNANSMLGREFCVSGIVVEGNKIGRTINFPTANICYPQDIIEIPNGVYAVTVELENSQYFKGVANFGTKPTVNKTNVKTLETHILNGFNKDIYGEKIKICFEKFIRCEKKFTSIDDLKNQIKKDILSI
ncbi:bifunctional riboflavin kinase/FAD synthetase [bacterium]|nr:bifunctional riboflavin kinase/FAD synthetase [bacterium]